MLNSDDYQIVSVYKRDISDDEINLADKFTIVTVGERNSNRYTILINSTPLDDIGNTLKEARIIGFNYL